MFRGLIGGVGRQIIIGIGVKNKAVSRASPFATYRNNLVPDLICQRYNTISCFRLW